MNIFSAGAQPSYAPAFEVFNGDHTPHAEIPSRVDRISEALDRSFHERVSVHAPATVEEVATVHDKQYIQYLSKTCSDLGLGDYRYPSVFPHGVARFGASDVAKIGRYAFDTFSPLIPETFHAASLSAAVALATAKYVHETGKGAYALCRPPGHHAESARFGGYCYFNNSALAAEYLSGFGRVAVLDVDFHHGNGMQQIFWERPDVLTVSIHADPDWKFPYFTGFADEIGQGAGEGYNLNISLSKNTGNDVYQRSLEIACERVASFHPTAIVIAYGADTHVDDPIGGFVLTTDYYVQMAATIASLRIPTMIVQEGGYNTALLGDNVVSFLSGF